MKLLAFTDTHGKKSNIDEIKLIAKKYKPDILISAGDFTNFGKNIDDKLKEFDFGFKLLYILGNHEEESEISYLPKNFFNIHMNSKIIKDILFLGCGGGIYGEIENNFEKCKNEFKKIIFNFKKNNPSGKVILLTHRPPKNTKLDYMKKYPSGVGAKNISDFIKDNAIDISISGHIHENFGKVDLLNKTKLYNPGPKGKIIKI